MVDYSALYRLSQYQPTYDTPKVDFAGQLGEIAGTITKNRALEQDQANKDRAFAEDTRRSDRDFGFRQTEQKDLATYRQRSLDLQERALNKDPEAIRTLRALGIDPTSPEARNLAFPKQAPQTIDVNTPSGQKITRQFDPVTRTWSDAPLAGLPPDATQVTPDMEDEQKLRKEVDAVGKSHREVRDAYGRILASKDDAAGDISLIFGFMRMLDPGSVVREGEFATAQNAAGVPDRIKNMYNQALSGQRLNPNQRDMFKSQARELYDTSSSTYGARMKQFEAIAKKYGHDPSRIIPDLGPEPGAAPAAAAKPPAAGARQAPDGRWYVPDPARPGKYLQVQ